LQLRRANNCFQRALVINPEGWSSMWALGKIHQRLGDQEAAFGWFAKAHALKPDQPDVAREAGITALDLGWADAALAFCQAAVVCRPDDPGLVCNLALAHCLAGDDTEAVRCVTEAAERNPADTVTANVRHFIGDIASSKRARPRSLQEFPRA
jgi:Flp pilus assembly protein TadD